jgi:hypothetical protein
LEATPDALKIAWPHIDHPDRFVRWAALTAIQHLPIGKWATKALTEKDSGKRANILLSLSKAAGIDPFHRKDTDPPVDQKMGQKILQSLLQIKWNELTPNERLSLVRNLPGCHCTLWQTRPERDQ